MKTSDDEFD